MRGTAISLVAVLAALVALALSRGRETFVRGVHLSFEQILHFLPVMVVALFVAGFAEALVPKEVVTSWLSDEAGWRGMALAWLAGMLTPGGGMIGLPLVAALYKAGVGLSVLITYATAFFTLPLLRMPIEVGFYGWRITALRWYVVIHLREDGGSGTVPQPQVPGDSEAAAGRFPGVSESAGTGTTSASVATL